MTRALTIALIWGSGYWAFDALDQTGVRLAGSIVTSAFLLLVGITRLRHCPWDAGALSAPPRIQLEPKGGPTCPNVHGPGTRPRSTR